MGKIRNASDMVGQYRDLLSTGLWKERRLVTFVDKEMNVIGHHHVNAGHTEAGTPFGFGEKAILALAESLKPYGIVFCSVHDEDDAKYTLYEVDFTKGMKWQLACLGVNIVDHVIMGRKTAYSFADGKLHE